MATKTKHMLTTVDNPFNPFTEFDEWFAFDTQHGYHTSSYLARVVRTSDEMSESEENLALEAGINEVIRYDESDMYRKVSMEV